MESFGLLPDIFVEQVDVLHDGVDELSTEDVVQTRPRGRDPVNVRLVGHPPAELPELVHGSALSGASCPSCFFHHR